MHAQAAGMTRELPGIKVSNSNMQHHPATKLTGIYATISSVDHSDILLEFISCSTWKNSFRTLIEIARLSNSAGSVSALNATSNLAELRRRM